MAHVQAQAHKHAAHVSMAFVNNSRLHFIFHPV